MSSGDRCTRWSSSACDGDRSRAAARSRANEDGAVSTAIDSTGTAVCSATVPIVTIRSGA